MKMYARYFSQAMVALALVVATPQARAAYPPEPQQAGNITYLTGGIGEEERNAMTSVKSDYNLSIMSAATSGAFVGDTQVRIRDLQGNELLNTQSGPLFYAQLPPGRYVIEGQSSGESRQQNITISENRPANVHFSWKAVN